MRPALRLAIVAGEASGDALGASVLAALRAQGIAVEVCAVGGERMAAFGVSSLFPLADIAVMGFGPVVARLPLLLRRIRQTAAAIVDFAPDIVLTIDAPDFCKRVARKVRAQAGHIPIVHWVCPSVWAWRPGRAPAMKPYIDEILCLLPFEPAALARLGGPEGVYIGHPLVEEMAEIAQADGAAKEALLLLPGSRRAEIARLLPLFLSASAGLGVRRVLPTLPMLEAQVRALCAGHPDVTIVVGEGAKRTAFAQAKLALAKSGTVTLELALGGIPMVTAYRVADWEAFIVRRLVSLPSAILPNLILGENVVPEFLQQAATAEALRAALGALLTDEAACARQRTAFERLRAYMHPPGMLPAAQKVVERLLYHARKAAGDTGRCLT